MFEVYIHPNRGQPLPKWWAYGSDSTKNTPRICWGKIGQITGKNDISAAAASRKYEKQADGYQYMGVFNVSEKELGVALKKAVSLYCGQQVAPSHPEERRLLESFYREVGTTSLLISPTIGVPDKDPSAKPKKPRVVKAMKKVAISDMSESWF